MALLVLFSMTNRPARVILFLYYCRLTKELQYLELLQLVIKEGYN